MRQATSRSVPFITATLALAVIPFLPVAGDGDGADPSLRLGPETPASVNADGGRLRVEPSVVRVGDTVVVAWNDSRAGRDLDSRVGVGIAWSWSSDGGRSFAFGGYAPGTSGADSWLAATASGEILLQVLSWGRDEQAISIYAVSPTPEPALTPRAVAARGPRVDKPAMAIGDDGWVGIVYTAGSEIRFVRSSDRAATWSSPAILSASRDRTRTGAAISTCGAHVVIAWVEGSGLELDEVWFVSSTDRGRSFSVPARVRALRSAVTPPPGYALGVGPAARISNNAWLACSGDQSPTFHLAYGEGRDAGSVALYQEGRTGQGRFQWSAPEVVAGGDSVWALWPSVAVIGDRVGILYYDSRHSEEATLMDTYVSLGGAGAFTAHRLSTRSTSWPDVPGDREHAPVQRNFGDYISLAADGPRAIATWTDGRTGAPRIMARSFEVEPGNRPRP